MTFQEYIPLALRTESPTHHLWGPARDATTRFRILHAALGFVTEAVELLAAVENSDEPNIREELGDLCWYAAIMHDASAIQIAPDWSLVPMRRLCNAYAHASEIIGQAGLIADKVKKRSFYGKPWQEESFGIDAREIVTLVSAMADFHGWTLSEILESNIRKLQARYPDRFTEHKAETRDLDAERKAMG